MLLLAEGSHTTKNVAFSWQSSTIFHPFGGHILKCLLLRDIKRVARTIHPGERKIIVLKPHYRPCVVILWRMNPHMSESTNNAQSHCRPRNNQCWWYIKIENLCANTLRHSIYPLEAAPKALHGKDGLIEWWFDPQCHQLAKIMGCSKETSNLKIWENRQNLHAFNLWPVEYHTKINNCSNPTPVLLYAEIYTCFCFGTNLHFLILLAFGYHTK